MRKTLFIVIPILIICVGAATGWYYYNQKIISSPEYSLQKIKESIETHDVDNFEKHVDVEGVLYRLLTDLPTLINDQSNAGAFGFFPEETIHFVNNMIEVQVKNTLQKTIKESVRTFIERGYFDKQLTRKGSIAKLIDIIPIDSIEMISINRIEKEGKICKISTKAYVEKYEKKMDVEFMMRDKGAYWQIAEITNIKDLIDNILIMRKEYPYTKLAGTAEYIKSTNKDELFLLSLSNAYAKTGKIEEAISLTESIKDEELKALAFIKISEALANQKEVEKSLKIVRENKIFNDSETLYLKALGLSRVALVLAKLKYTQESYSVGKEALEVLNKSKEAHITSKIIFKMLAASQAAAAISISGKKEEADSIFSDIFTELGSLEFSFMKSMSMIMVSLNLGEAGKQEQAIKYLNEGIKISESVKNETINWFLSFLYSMEMNYYPHGESQSTHSENMSVLFNRIQNLLRSNTDSLYAEVENYEKVDLMPKARSIAKKCEDYLLTHPGLERHKFFHDKEFSRIAVQSVGNSGYSFLFQEPEPETGRNWTIWAHPNPNIIGIDDMDMIRKALGPYFDSFFGTIAKCQSGKESEGAYKWKDPDGKIREKYMVIAPIGNEKLSKFYIAATYYTEEYELDKDDAYFKKIGTFYARSGFPLKAIEVCNLIKEKENRKTVLGIVCSQLIPLQKSAEEEKAFAEQIMGLIE